MANILTAAEAALILRCDVADPLMLALLPSVDAYIKNGTGRDWAKDSTIDATAKAAALLYIDCLHEGGWPSEGLRLAFDSLLVQLEALALQLERAGVPSEALQLVGTNITTGMAVSANLVLAFNHAMAPGATAAVTLETAAGAPVVTVNALDATGKTLTVDPAAPLAASTQYVLHVHYAADVYGQTLDTDFSFWTAP